MTPPPSRRSGIHIAVFGSSSTRPATPAWRDAERLGAALALRGWAVRTGGYGGTMEAVSAGAAAVGGDVIGVTAPALFPDRDGPNAHLTEEVPAATLLRRIDAMIEGAAAAVAMPGSLGTFTELVATWNHVYLERRLGRPALPLVIVGPAWRELIDAVVTATGSPRDGIVEVAQSSEVPRALERSLAPRG